MLAAASAGAQTVSLPAVPYLPQSEALCGGASLAMVLRYWGLPSVRPEDFASALDASGTGIPAARLGPLAQARGFQAHAFRGTQAEAVRQLAQGRPLIALLSARGQGHHYVVMLAWSNQRVLVHDPALGPYRVIPQAEWLRRWDATGRWALLVLPPDASPEPAALPSDPPAPRLDACAALVQPGVELALAGEVDAARDALTAAAASCPGSSAPVRELAALEFRRERWPAAAALAADAVRRDPLDEFGWKLLATSLYLAGRREDALAAWNQIGEPRLDLVQINGLQHTQAPIAYEYLGDTSGTLLTPARFRRLQRRVDALPAAQSSRVSYRPQPDGGALLDVDVVERPAFDSLRSVLASAAVIAISEHAIGADVRGLSSSGESARLFGQWQPERAHGALTAASPHFLGLPGVVTVEATWDEQSYRLSPGGAAMRERRQRASLSLAEWWAADTRAALGTAFDEWSGRGGAISLAGEIEQRLLRDHVAVGGGAAGWWSIAGAPFYAASARVSVRTRITPERPRVRLDASYTFASARAPLALWSGAGTGPGRGLPLLRAHPLLHAGVIESAAFGRELVGVSLEAEAPIVSVGPVRIRVAGFVDVARALAPQPSGSLVDVGAGLRLQPPGWKSALRLDLATPWGSLHPHVSTGWQWEWP